MGPRRADGADDPFADPGDDRLLGGAADHLGEVGPHGHRGPDLELDAVLGDRVQRLLAAAAGGAVDDLGIDAGLDGLNHVAAGEVDGGGGLEGRSSLALWAATMARATRGTLPPAR